MRAKPWDSVAFVCFGFDSCCVRGNLRANMKKIFYYFILFALSSLFTFPAISQEMKVGIVDMNRVFGEYHKTKEIEKEIQKKRDTARKDVLERDNELKEKINGLKVLQREIADPVSSREVRAASQKRAQQVADEARVMRDGVLDFARKREMQLMEMSKRKRNVILEEIQLAVSKHSKKEGYDLVFNKSARSTKGISFLLYSKDARDFSTKMISELNGG